MLFLQGVTKYADKLKQSNEPKVSIFGLLICSLEYLEPAYILFLILTNTRKKLNELQLIDKDNGVVLRDNAISSGAGVTWAFEVGGQSMVCPIIVEDLSPPGQMLIEVSN